MHCSAQGGQDREVGGERRMVTWSKSTHQMTIKTVMMGMLRMVMIKKDDTGRGRGLMMQRRDVRVSRSQLMEIMTMATMMTKTMKLVIMVGEQVVRERAGQPMAMDVRFPKIGVHE